MQFSTKIDGFEQTDSQGSENSYNSYEQYPLEKFLIFTIYQNYTLALISCKMKKKIKSVAPKLAKLFNFNLRNARETWFSHRVCVYRFPPLNHPHHTSF